VTRAALRVLEALSLPTLGLLIVAALVPGRLALATHIWLLLVCGIALAAVLRALLRAYPPAPRPALEEALERTTPTEERLPSLARLEREVTLGASSSYDLHYRLRPTLRETAVGLLAVRRGIALDAEPQRARAALGDATWQLVRPDREPPDDRLARGLTENDLRALVESLEAL
jgi:hypothetical protein